MRIAYVLYGEVLAPVVAAQTFPLLEALRERGHETHLVALTSPRRWFRPSAWREALRAAERAAGGHLTVLTHPPRRWRLYSAVGPLRRALRRISADVVHCRQSRAAALASRSGRGPILADLRGVRPEEFLLALGKREADLTPKEARSLAAVRDEDGRALRGASAVVCVSGPHREHLGGGEGIFVIPNAAREVDLPSAKEREARRAQLGIGPTERVAVYSGSLAAWQCGAEAVRLYRAAREADPELRLALLTHDLKAGRALLAREGVADGVLRSVSPVAARELLPLFDAALLLRHEDVVNRVACPVKFAEYLHAGLPVVATSGIGDVSGWIREGKGLGAVLSGPEDPEGPAHLARVARDGDRGACRAFALDRLTFERTTGRYEEAYRFAAAGGR